jgi:hypothetical protein
MRASTPIADAEPPEPLPGWVRLGLLAAVAVVAGVFSVAYWIDPYRGGPGLRMGAHRQLGLPPCSFLDLTGVPCPSCGLTTSFAYTVRGDFSNGLRANWVGVLMVIGCVVMVPWAAYSAWKGRLLGVKSLEGPLVATVLISFLLLFLRWGVLVGGALWAGSSLAGP